MQQNFFQRVGVVLRQVMAYVRPTCYALLTPQAVVLDTGGTSRPQVRQCPENSLDVEQGMQQAVKVLLQMLDASKVQGKRLHVYLSDGWTRPMIMPLVGKASKPEDINALLQSQYRRVYGDLLPNWHIAWDLQQGRLYAQALPAKPWHALQQGITQHGNVLQVASTSMSTVVEQVMAQQSTGWIVQLSPQNMSLVYQENTTWQHWVVIPLIINQEAQLAEYVLREAARLQNTCQQVSILHIAAEPLAKQLEKELKTAGWQTRMPSSALAAQCQVIRLSQALG
jgi:hypothetical protein